MAQRTTSNYGRIGVNRKSTAAHRVSYELTYGPIPDGLYVCHRCDNPPCVRPDHLFLDEPKGNTQDMLAKGRGLNGTRHVSAKLTDAKVIALRQRYAEGGIGRRKLAAEYGIGPTTLMRIVRREKWKHI